MAYCGKCSATRQPDALFCGTCGTRFTDEAAAEPVAAPSDPSGDTAAANADRPFGGEMTLAAILLSLFMPLSP